MSSCTSIAKLKGPCNDQASRRMSTLHCSARQRALFHRLLTLTWSPSASRSTKKSIQTLLRWAQCRLCSSCNRDFSVLPSKQCFHQRITHLKCARKAHRQAVKYQRDAARVAKLFAVHSCLQFFCEALQTFCKHIAAVETVHSEVDLQQRLTGMPLALPAKCVVDIRLNTTTCCSAIEFGRFTPCMSCKSFPLPGRLTG